MYDFLDKIGLKAVLEAIKGKMPTSLPANGGNADYATNAGNADKVGGKSADEFMPYIGYVDDLGAVNQNCICSWSSSTLNTPFIAGKTNAAAGICIVNNVNGLWPTYFVICAGAKQCFIHYQNPDNGGFVGNWKEISTTPIKSTGWITTPTNEYGKIVLPNSDSRGYISVVVSGCYNQIYMDNGNYVFCVTDGNFTPQVNTAVSYIAFYIE